jgi:hypothetical protein
LTSLAPDLHSGRRSILASRRRLCGRVSSIIELLRQLGVSVKAAMTLCGRAFSAVWPFRRNPTSGAGRKWRGLALN